MKRSTFIATLAAMRSFGQDDPQLGRIVLLGLPTLRAVQFAADNKTVSLDKKESEEYLCAVTSRDGKYIWGSRERKELLRHRSGLFDVFCAVDGSGYIKVGKPLGGDGSIDYMEHLHLHLATYTYWGKLSIPKE